jgi:nucleotide-binding universal stress UspA family protein
LKLALVAKSKLDIFHVDRTDEVDWDQLPSVREWLERWGVLGAGSEREDVNALGLHVHKALVPGRDPLAASTEYLQTHRADVIVLAIHRHDGALAWLNRSTGEPISSNAAWMSLLIPHGVQGFVSRESGEVTLRRILVPTGHKPRPQPSLDAVEAIVRGLGLSHVEVTLLYVGEDGDRPMVRVPKVEGLEVREVTREGSVPQAILDASVEFQSDLIVMATDGPDGFLDGLRGSNTQRVLRMATCPVAVVPERRQLRL